MILSNKRTNPITLVFLSILISIPVSIVFVSLYFTVLNHNQDLKLIETFYNYFYILRNFGIRPLLIQLIQNKTIPVIIGMAFLFSVIFVKICFKSRDRSRDRNKEIVHINGPKSYEGKEAIRHAKSMHKKDLNDKSTSSGIKIHSKIKITELREQNNFLILGTTGAGKSTAFKPLVKQAIKRGDYALIYDEKGEYTQSFFSKKTTALLAPWDDRSLCWDISDDIKSKEDAELLAKCLIPDSKSSDPVWDQGARIILVSMITTLINTKKKAWGWEDLYEQMTVPPDQARSVFAKYHKQAGPLLTPDSKTTTSFYVHIMSKLTWIEALAKAWPKRRGRAFSLRKWVTENNGKRVVIVQSDSQFQSLSEPLCNAVISFMTNHFLALSNSQPRKTWLFIDEFANLPRNPKISQWLSLGRTNGARSVICTQSISQLHDIYGKGMANIILNLLSNVIAFRIGAAGEDAEYAANIFGQYKAGKPSYDHPDRTETESYEQLVKPSELVHLSQPTKRGVEGFMQIPSWNAVYKLRWPLFKESGKAKKKVPAQWLTNSATQSKTQSKTKQQANRLNKRRVNNDVD